MKENLTRGFFLSLLIGLISSSLLLMCFGEATLAQTKSGTDPETFELLSHQSPNYKFQIIPPNTQLPPGFERLDFDDSAFQSGTAPFGGGGGGAGAQNCPLRSTVQTEWPIGSQLLVRHQLFIPKGATNIRIMISVDNDLLAAFFNGSPILDVPIRHDECPHLDDYRIDVPSHLVYEQDNNLLTFLVGDRSSAAGAQFNETFFDLRVLGNLSSDTLDQAAAQAATASLVFPREPVSNVQAACNLNIGPPEVVITFVAERTGERGQIRISDSGEQQTTSYSFGGALISTSRVARLQTGMTRSESETTQVLAERLAVTQNDPTLPALGSVFSYPSIQQTIQNCLKQNFAGSSCRDQCEEITTQKLNDIALGGLAWCGITGLGFAVAGASATTTPLGGAAVAFLGGAYCGLRQYIDHSRLRNWGLWENECNDCCAKNCPANICTSNQPRVSDPKTPPQCEPPRPR